MKDLNQIPPAAEQTCLLTMIERMESDLGTMQQRAAAWSRGDVAALRQLPYPDEQTACLEALASVARISSLMQQYQADAALAARRAELLDAARETESQFRQAQARRAPVTEVRRLADDLDAALTAAMRAAYAARRAEIFEPYHAHIRALLDERQAAGRRTILVAQHTMTDVYKGAGRDMHGAVLYNRDRRFAGLVLEMLRRERELTFADNEPYFVSDETDYTVPLHGEVRGLPHVEIEIRQDLVKDEAGQAAWAERVARALEAAEAALWPGQ